MEVFDFVYQGKSHSVAVLNNEDIAPVDAGSIYYNLDDLGVIYNKNITWISYERLASTNDSINDLIDRALEVIIVHSKDHRIIPSKDETIQFVEPKIAD